MRLHALCDRGELGSPQLPEAGWGGAARAATLLGRAGALLVRDDAGRASLRRRAGWARTRRGAGLRELHELSARASLESAMRVEQLLGRR